MGRIVMPSGIRVVHEARRYRMLWYKCKMESSYENPSASYTKELQT